MTNPMGTLISQKTPFYKKQWIREIFIFLVALGVYQISRALAIGDASTAFEHAHQVINFEKAIGIFNEIQIQQFFLRHEDLLQWLNAFYIRAHLPITIIFFVWLFNFHKKRYPNIRNVFLIANGLAIFFYIFYPCAPPRMMNEEGFVDTLLVISKINLYEGNLSKTFNQFAAVPSMHFGYSMLIGVVTLFLSSSYVMKILASIYPFFVLMVIVATGNHFHVDAILGGLVMGASYLIFLGWMNAFRKDTFEKPSWTFVT